MSLRELNVKELNEKLYNKEIKCSQILDEYFDEIEKDNEREDKINAFVELFKESAYKQAQELQAKVDAGERLPLAGVAVALKDNIAYEGHEMNCASKILEGYKAPYNAYVTQRLLDNGALIIGRVNMDEFAMGSSTETSAKGITRNPHDRSRIPGGSSGGAAAAVAASQALIALGSDTGGSIRQPASLCGTVGLKPTYGRVSRYGLTAFGSSLDQIGPITKNVYDAALLMNTIAGHDNNDSTSMDVHTDDYTEGIADGIEGMKVGFPKEFFVPDMSDELKDAMNDVRKKYEGLGAKCVDVSLPHTEYGVSVYYIVATAEASSNLARFDGIRYGRRAKDEKNLVELYKKSKMEGFGEEVKRRILLGTYVLSSGYYDAYYLKALKVRTLIKQDFENAFKEVDLIAAPTSPSTAFKIGEKADDPIAMYLSDIFTITANLAGVPAMSIPCGKDSEGLPIGFQLLGNHFDESSIFKAAYSFEQAQQ